MRLRTASHHLMSGKTYVEFYRRLSPWFMPSYKINADFRERRWPGSHRSTVSLARPVPKSSRPNRGAHAPLRVPQLQEIF